MFEHGSKAYLEVPLKICSRGGWDNRESRMLCAWPWVQRRSAVQHFFAKVHAASDRCTLVLRVLSFYPAGHRCDIFYCMASAKTKACTKRTLERGEPSED